MANANYKLREVSAVEVAKVFGSARRALRVTRGDEATALHFIHNPDLAATATEWEAKQYPRLSTHLSQKLLDMAEAEAANAERAERDERKAKKWAERLTMARRAYSAHGTIAAVIRACKCDSITAKKLIAELQSEARP